MTFSAAFLARYEIQRRLGAGGMGEVYLARETSLDRLVAIKTVLSSAMSSEDARLRFLREARVTGALQHPAIVKVLDQGEDDGRLFIVYDYVGGGDLGKRLGERGALPPAEFFAVAVPLLDALAEAHKCGVLHRDIKADNVLLDGQGHPRLADFGLAKAAEEGGLKTATGILMGTPRYMAPELASGSPASPATDQYALGVLFYEMLAGRPPFAASTPLATLRMHLDVPPPPLLNHRSDVPEELELAIHRALAKTADRRWESVAAMRDAFDGMETRATWEPRGQAARPAASTGVATMYAPAGDTTAGQAGPGAPAAPMDASRNLKGSGVRRGTGRSAALSSPGQPPRIATGERTRVINQGGGPKPESERPRAASRIAAAAIALVVLLAGAGLLAVRYGRSDPRYAALALHLDRGRNAAVLRWDAALPGREVTVRRAGDGAVLGTSAAGVTTAAIALPGLGLGEVALDVELTDPAGRRYPLGVKRFEEITLDAVEAELVRIRTVPGTEATTDAERAWPLEERLEYRFTHALNAVFGRRPSRTERYSGMSQDQVLKAAARSGVDKAVAWYRENRLEMVLEQAAVLLGQPGDWRTKGAIVRTAHAIANLEAFLLSAGMKVPAPALRFQYGLKPGRMPRAGRVVLDGPGDFARAAWFSALLAEDHELTSAKLSLSQGMVGDRWYTRAVNFQLAARQLKPRLSDPVGGLLAAANSDEAFPGEYLNEGIGTGWSQMVLEPVALEALKLPPPMKRVTTASVIVHLRAATELTHTDVTIGPLLFCFRTPPGYAALRDAHAWGPEVRVADPATTDPALSSQDATRSVPRDARPGIIHRARFDAEALAGLKAAPVVSVHCARGDGTLDKPSYWMPSWKVLIGSVCVRWDQAAGE